MSSPPVPDLELRRTAELLRQAVIEGCVPPGGHVGTGKKSAVSRVAELGGWKRSAAYSRVCAVLELGMVEPVVAAPSQITAPVIPSQEEPVEETWARLEREQARRSEHAAAIEWMQYDVAGNEPFALTFVGDPHADQCDAKRLRRHLDVIEQTDRMWAVGMGDWLNSWNAKLRGQYAMQTTTERQAIQLIKAVLKHPKWLLLLLGNHDGQRWHGHGNPVMWLEHSAPVPMQEWQAKFTMACGGRTWRIWAAHDFPGVSMWNALHGPGKRAMQTGATADLYIAGDHHTYGCAQLQHEHTGRPYWVGRARGYKPMDYYALEKGYGDAGGAAGIGHSITAICDPRTGEMVCRGNVEEAAAYLTFLRLRRLT